MADLLAVLYGKILDIDPRQPTWPNRDRFILSKGHGCAAYYAVLAEVGFFPVEWLDTFYQNGSRLPGHATHIEVPASRSLQVPWGMAFQLPQEWRWLPNEMERRIGFS